ncbi:MULTISPECIES: DnaJ domain-containing protein [unclassified Ruegeria]|uniref:DnaJ domain-containing protein n=1 Tax=unclassified Ruegeria TaxID=2625375 RepID=UPI001488666C|nr:MULTISPECIES: DnaJ domain-containing protein [unclassified Ruegeria]
MEPVDRIRARAEALHALGLNQQAGSADIRNAWRQIAFHAHPDCSSSDAADFTRAKEAYDLLREEGLAGKAADAGKPKRPRLRKRVITLEDADIDACRSLLDKALAHVSEEQEANQTEATVDLRADSDHIPEAVGCYGRNLTYFVPSPVCEGANRIALPTSILAGTRRTETEVLSFQCKEAGAGEVVVPETILNRKFPGAKSVRIRFEADQKTQDEFWLAS